MITKKPEIVDNFFEKIIYYQNARSAFKDILINLMKNTDITILIPAYIGYSPKEGSGIFDPIVTIGIKYKFYSITEELYVDLDDLESLILQTDGKFAILLVHYWGYVDPQYEQIIELCKRRKVIIIEDLAHAFFTEYYGQRIGKSADYLIYSLHKMFPVSNGGMLKIRNDSEFDAYHKTDLSIDIWSYDMAGIIQARKHNASLLEEMLFKEEKINLLRNNLMFSDCVPQTFPLLLGSEVDRYAIYLEMNNSGYGVTSLYHTLINEIGQRQYPNSYKLSKKILNLPVHQDVSEKELIAMCDTLKKIIDKYSYSMR